ncbi:MAG: hypothetical protein Q9160_008859 [Pyrenula sp. 1 TL-2023]
MKHICSFSSHFASLKYLALPRASNFPKHSNKPLIIPTTLHHLSFSGFIPDATSNQIDLPNYALWPSTLENLTFTDCWYRHLSFDSATVIYDLLRHSFPGPQLKSLHISPLNDCIVYKAIQGLEFVAPNLTSLTLPRDLATAHIDHLITSYPPPSPSSTPPPHPHLEHLKILPPPPQSISPIHKPSISSLWKLAETLPPLWLIEIYCPDNDNESDDGCSLEIDAAEAQLQQNARRLNREEDEGGRRKRPLIKRGEAGLFWVVD